MDRESNGEEELVVIKDRLGFAHRAFRMSLGLSVLLGGGGYRVLEGWGFWRIRGWGLESGEFILGNAGRGIVGGLVRR